MADQKITLLNPLATIETGDLFAIVDITATAETKKVTVDALVTYIESVAAFADDVLTTKGDVYTYDTANQRLGVGTDGQVLTADSAEATGLKWATPSSGISANTDLFIPVSNGSALLDSLLRQEANTGAFDLISDAVNHVYRKTGTSDADSLKLVAELISGVGHLTFDGLTGGLLTIIDDKDNELFTASDVSGNPLLYADADWLIEFGNPFSRPFKLVYNSTTGTTANFFNSVRYNMLQLVDYADDTAAGVGGLVTGDLYRVTSTKAIAVKD